MRNDTRNIFNQYLSDVAEVNELGDGVVSPGGISKFSLLPSVEQVLAEVIAEEVTFLDRINRIYVDESEGDRLLIGQSSPLASNTDTLANDRAVTQLGGPGHLDKFHCQKTDFDSAIRYKLLDMWAKFPNFADVLARWVLKQIGRDEIMMGWNGTSRAANSSRANNPLLQDVAIGWLKKIEIYAPAQILKDGATPGKVRIGKGGDYANIDAAVFDLAGEKIHEAHQEDTEMVAIVGRELFHDKYLGLVSDSDAATERVALDIVMSTKQVGGIPAIRVPFFPKRGILITRLDNLSIYIQEATTRRTIVDNAKRDQIEDYQSENLDYMVEDYTACAYLDASSVELRTNDDSEAVATWD